MVVHMDLGHLPDPFSSSQARAGGLTSSDLLELLQKRDVEQVAHGLYRRQQPPPSGESWAVTLHRHLDRVQVALRRFPGHVPSHSTAAVIHGLELMTSPDSPVELTCLQRQPRSRREGDVILHHCDDNDVPTTEVAGMEVTTLARTVADTMRTRRLAHGTALLDSVRRQELVTLDDVVTVLDGQRRWRGRPRAMAGVTLSDPRRETWLESFSFVRLHEFGIPIPLAQPRITDLDGHFVGRPDGLLSEYGVFLEADGTGKYFLDGLPDESVEETARRKLAEERQRHVRLESLALRGVRWTPLEILRDADAVAGRVRAVLHPQPLPIRAYAEWEKERRRIPFALATPSVDMETLKVRRRRRRVS